MTEKEEMKGVRSLKVSSCGCGSHLSSDKFFMACLSFYTQFWRSTGKLVESLKC